jgi:hypothetical protein
LNQIICWLSGAGGGLRFPLIDRPELTDDRSSGHSAAGCVPGGTGIPDMLNARETVDVVRRQRAGAKYVTELAG